MKKYIFIIIFPLLLLILYFGWPSVTVAQTMNDYCQMPPFVASIAPPNVLLVNDVSGSMGWAGYSYGDTDANSDGVLDNYDPSKTYEGYFIPSKYYKQSATADPFTGVYPYEETVLTGETCVQTCDSWTCRNRAWDQTCLPPGSPGNTCGGGHDYGGWSHGGKYACCTHQTSSGDCGVDSGNYLNYVHMERIDLLRWAMTGGDPSTCKGSNTFNPGSCDPELWADSGNMATGKVGTICNDSLDINGDGIPDGGCILMAADGTEVKVPWSRVYDGLAFQFKSLLIRPRMGAMFFDGSGVRTDKVYVGDFCSKNANSATDPYMNLITYVNSQIANGGTATGPAMWDALNYYAQNSPQYGGYPAQSGSGDRWKNPLYLCDQGGTNCVYYPCVRDYVILMSDGQWNTDGSGASSCSIDDSSADPVVPAYQMHHGFTNAPTGAQTKVSGIYSIGLFMGSSGQQALENVAMYGSFDNSAKTWPDDLSGYPQGTCCADDCGSCGTGGTNAKGSSCTPLPTSTTDWDKNGDGLPDTFYGASDATGIRQSILNAVLDILAKATSGTAASVLASGEGSGANLVQATYYPRRPFYNSVADWVGGLQDFWYYVDPMFSNSEIRAEGQPPDHILDLLAPSGDADPAHHDYIVNFYYDQSTQRAMADLYYDQYGNGVESTNKFETVDFDALGHIWEAGKMLWSRDPATRLIYTPLDTSKPLTDPANQFGDTAPADNVAALRPLLNTDASTSTDATTADTENNQLATNLIDWVRGTDIPPYTFSAGTLTYRSRTVAVDDTSGTKVWKLGDIVDSTPRIVSWPELNQYDKDPYSDSTYDDFVHDNEYTSDSSLVDSTHSYLAQDSTQRYLNRGMVFVGANDGMLHAFKLGRLGLKWKSRTATQMATLNYCQSDPSTACAVNSDCATGDTCVVDGDLGQEEWAFIPKSVLPYLQYLTDTSYCHLYSVDLTPYVLDASIDIDTNDSTNAASSTCDSASYSNYWECNKTAHSWRTILIGGMRYGGACKNEDATCTTDLNGDGVIDSNDCVKTPVNGLGYSSYFALDVTDPYNPKFLWEFTDPDMGFSSSGPAIVRISARKPDSGDPAKTDPDKSKNGRWFVVFGSGPTGPINTAAHQNLGRSDQDLRLFVLDLKTGALLKKFDTGIQNAYAGTIVNNNQDTDEDYQDNVVYVGYTKTCTDSSHQCTAGTWGDGGILRLLTNQDLNGTGTGVGTGNGNSVCGSGDTALNPGCWTYGTVIDGIGSVTSAIGHLENFNTGNLWLFAGTGRYFYRMSGSQDDPSQQRMIMGVKDPCFDGLANNSARQFTTGCTSSLGFSDLSEVDLSSAAGVDTTSTTYHGWYVPLDAAGSQYQAERDITDPLATTSGLVLFTTFSPNTDPCSAGGVTALWAVNYNNGAAPGALLKGKAIIQVSTDSIEQIDLSKQFTQKNGRKTTNIQGVPPTAQGLALIASPPPVKRVVHMMEQ
ncbi:MAG: hypothetical protein P8Z71_09115 [Candidatus Sulfobium sp.]